MRLEELLRTLQNPDLLRIFKDKTEVFTGYLAGLALTNGTEFGGELFDKYKDETVKSFRCIPEITHKRWKELNLMQPLRPEETPDFSFSDLQMKLYYTIYI